MKKAIVILLIAILAVSLLAACSGANGSASNYSASAPQASYSTGEGGNMYDYPETETMYQYSLSGEAAPAPSAAPMPQSADSGFASADNNLPDTSGAQTAADTGLAEKIIYTASADIETVNFEETLEKVQELINFNNAFIESSYIGGRNYAQSYYGYQTYRSANYTLRIPKDRFKAVTDNLDILGNVISVNSDAVNITSQFRDVESHLSSYRIQEERLLAMLEKTDTVSDMIEIESRLAEVRYNIESFTSTLNNWQNQVDYSTLTLYIREVENFTELIAIQRTYWQQIGDGLQSTIRSVGRFFTNLFKWIIINLPVLIILAVIVVVVVLIIGRRRRKKRAANKDDID